MHEFSNLSPHETTKYADVSGGYGGRQHPEGVPKETLRYIIGFLLGILTFNLFQLEDKNKIDPPASFDHATGQQYDVPRKK